MYSPTIAFSRRSIVGIFSFTSALGTVAVHSINFKLVFNLRSRFSEVLAVHIQILSAVQKIGGWDQVDLNHTNKQIKWVPRSGPLLTIDRLYRICFALITIPFVCSLENKCI